jgi:hypothetical protein
VLAVAGCSKKEGNVATSSGSIGTSTGAATTSVRVADVNLGTGIGTDKHVTGQTESFKPNDTIYASVHTTGSASNATLTARWTFQDGQNVDERSETISPSGDTYTEFHVSKPGGWPAGNYTLHLLLNGQEIATKNFSVSR